MQLAVSNQKYYDALLRRDSNFDGIVYYGIRTTGIFCRSVCTARKPKFENCEFFATAQQALLAGYRPCKRCNPMHLPGEITPWIKDLVQAVENQPEKRWTDRDFRDLGVDTTTVRRQFKKRFGMTFVAYARARRMGLALTQIRDGNKVIDVQLNLGYDSSSGFRDAFSRTLGTPPKKFNGSVLLSKWIDTRIGPMLAIANDQSLLLLEFTDRRGLEKEIEKLRITTHAMIVPGSNSVLEQITAELDAYFSGTCFSFQTSIELRGSDFQRRVWCELLKIPVGETRSYARQAASIGSPNAVRAVARANGANQLAIIVPCHRVVGMDGNLTGYAGGLSRKKWLLDHEARTCDAS